MAELRKTIGADVGLLIIRLGLGTMFVIFGFGKLAAGPERWKGLGGAMSTFGITFAPTFWGLCAALAEFLGGILLAVGLLYRPAVFLLWFTMVTAAAMLINAGTPMTKWAHAFNLAIVFAGLFFLGPGRLSLKAAIPFCDKRLYG